MISLINNVLLLSLSFSLVAKVGLHIKANATDDCISIMLELLFYFKDTMLMALITSATEHYHVSIKLSPFGILRIIAVGIFLSICDVILIKRGFILIACDSPFFCCQRIILRFDV